MKYILLLLLSFPVLSSDICHEWADAAEAIMTHRQENTTRHDINALLERAELDIGTKALFNTIINSAYNDNLVHNRIEDKLSVIEDFSVKVFIKCLDSTAVVI